MKKIVIIGNGISGITAARNIRKLSDFEITVISSETDYFFSRTALMYIYMGHMRFKDTQPYEPHFWTKNRINLVRDYVEKVDFESKALHLKTGQTISYDELILATGSKPNKFGWKGQDLPGVQGLYSYQDLELLEQNSKNIKRGVIVGGGLIGIELAEMLLSRGIAVTFLVREANFWSSVLPKQESELIGRHIKEHHVDMRYNTNLDEIIAGPDGRVCAVKTKETGETIDCQMVGLTAGVSPNISFLKDSTLETERGILVDEFLRTNHDGVYAIGDCAQFRVAPSGRRPIEQVWYTGRMMGETVANTICGKPSSYQPGHWFNSAKFFDIEYQTYGWVFSKLREGEEDFYWESKDGKKCMHFVYEKSSRKFIGINTFGIRLRHHAFDRWLNEERTVDFIIEHLADANFDPELYAQHEHEIVREFNTKTGGNLKLKKKSWTNILNFS
ncbi:MAG: NAD(P)/FAD-dependent oxidoreductase [Flavobacteriales bacterium]|nr:NAD(P)/FAD-dependent oxidoreductase [Flavobacteriales bacterium]